MGLEVEQLNIETAFLYGEQVETSFLYGKQDEEI
jgi:hypothetical protein